MTRAEQREQSSRGFTLAEMAVASAVLALIGGAIFTLMFQGQRSYQSQQDLITITQDARLTLDQITSFIRQAGNDPEGTLGVPAIDILTPAAGHFQINTDITGSETGDKGDPDGDNDDLYEDVEVSYNAGLETLYLRIAAGRGLLPVAENVTSFVVTYYDSAGATTSTEADIAKVRVDMVLETPRADQQTGRKNSITLQAEAWIRSQVFSLF